MSDNPNVFPAIRYHDAPAAIAWLAKAFGLEQHFVVPAGHNRITHAELQIGRGMVMLNSKGDPRATANPWDTVDHGIYVCVADVDAHYARAKAAGAEIARELQDTDYGSREYSVRDLEGHLWSFGTYDPYAAS
jgi:uncharacterized glyoxalase superfamily protein PhnB